MITCRIRYFVQKFLYYFDMLFRHLRLNLQYNRTSMIRPSISIMIFIIKFFQSYLHLRLNSKTWLRCRVRLYRPQRIDYAIGNQKDSGVIPRWTNKWHHRL